MIVLSAQILDHPYWADPERFRAWVDVLLMADSRGEFVASVRALARRWRWSNGKVERFLASALDTNELLVVEDTPNGIKYTVVDYFDYAANGEDDLPPQQISLVPPKIEIPYTEVQHTLGGAVLVGSANLVEERVGQVRGAVTKKKAHSKKIETFIQVIFLYWSEMMGKTGRTVLDKARKDRLRKRLHENDGDIAELLCTVDGALKDDFLMGTSERSDGKAYNGIEQVFRDRGQVERLAPLSKYFGEEVHPFMQDRSES